MEASDYIQTVRKWQHLRDASATACDLGAAGSAREMETERGTRKKTLQPETALGASSIAFDEADSKHDFDLGSLERAERRFRALNPHGCIDYHLSESISLSAYLDALGAHLCYWTHRDFAVFVLTQLFMDFTKDDEITLVPQVQQCPSRTAQDSDTEVADASSDASSDEDES